MRASALICIVAASLGVSVAGATAGAADTVGARPARRPGRSCWPGISRSGPTAPSCRPAAATSARAPWCLPSAAAPIATGRPARKALRPILVGGKVTPGTNTFPIVFWPYAPPIWDYIHRAMPYNRPGRLTADETYSLMAFLLFKNGIIQEDDVMDAKSLPRVQMPHRAEYTGPVGWTPATPRPFRNRTLIGGWGLGAGGCVGWGSGLIPPYAPSSSVFSSPAPCPLPPVPDHLHTHPPISGIVS